MPSQDTMKRNLAHNNLANNLFNLKINEELSQHESPVRNSSKSKERNETAKIHQSKLVFEDDDQENERSDRDGENSADGEFADQPNYACRYCSHHIHFVESLKLKTSNL